MHDEEVHSGSNSSMQKTEIFYIYMHILIFNYSKRCITNANVGMFIYLKSELEYLKMPCMKKGN